MPPGFSDDTLGQEVPVTMLEMEMFKAKAVEENQQWIMLMEQEVDDVEKCWVKQQCFLEDQQR